MRWLNPSPEIGELISQISNEKSLSIDQTAEKDPLGTGRNESWRDKDESWWREWDHVIEARDVRALPLGFVVGHVAQQVLVFPIPQLDFRSEIRAVLQLARRPRGDRAHFDGLDLLLQSL